MKQKTYFIEEINQNELISKTHKKIFDVLKYTEYLLILVHIVNGCVSICSIAPLVSIPVDSNISTIKFF